MYRRGTQTCQSLVKVCVVFWFFLKCLHCVLRALKCSSVLRLDSLLATCAPSVGRAVSPGKHFLV